MKKIFIALLCAILMCAMTVVAFADEETPTDIVEVEEETPAISTEEILNWIKDHPEEVSVIVTVLTSLVVTLSKLKLNNKTNITCNNNAIAIAEHSNAAIQEALDKMTSTAAVVEKYKDEIAKMLDEIRQSDEEKRNLQAALNKVENYLETAKLSNIEFANELASLLLLANIPNSRKEELYSRHRKAVDALAEVEMSARNMEVKEDDGEET